jgi:hypothetical protein
MASEQSLDVARVTGDDDRGVVVEGSGCDEGVYGMIRRHASGCEQGAGALRNGAGKVCNTNAAVIQ